MKREETKNRDLNELLIPLEPNTNKTEGLMARLPDWVMMHEWYPPGSKLYDVVAELANFLNGGKPVEVVVINNHDTVNAWCILGSRPPISVYQRIN